MQKRSLNGQQGLIYPAPYSQVSKRRKKRGSTWDLDSLSELLVDSSEVQAKVRIVRNGWVVTDTEGSQFYYTDPTDALHAIAVHLEMPPVNPLAVLAATD
ncbi:MAG: hypothetical protein HRF45_05855 [Fimbriimonadia bacterium]|jgi:hypothetical protein